MDYLKSEVDLLSIVLSDIGFSNCICETPLVFRALHKRRRLFGLEEESKLPCNLLMEYVKKLLPYFMYIPFNIFQSFSTQYRF